MKRIISLIACMMMLCIITMTVTATSEDQTADSLAVGVPVDRCPLFYQDSSTGEPVGIGVDLMHFAAEEAGYNASFLCLFRILRRK